MPINLPRTLFHEAMKARKDLARILNKILTTRRETKRDYNDLLGSFMSEKEGLTDEQIADNVIGIIFAARDTTASVLTWILKFLGENPSVLQAVTVRPISQNQEICVIWIGSSLETENSPLFLGLQDEQEAIMNEKQSREDNNLTWGDAKNMPITSRVIQETLRVASVLSFTFREAVEDVEFDGEFWIKNRVPLFFCV